MVKKRYKSIVILAGALALLLLFAGVSVAKYVVDEKKELVGIYTDFVMSHNGSGQTAVLQGQQDGTYVGYIVVTVSNFNDAKISKRDVRFSLRAPSESELADRKVVDAWGNSYALAADSTKYEVEIVNESGSAYTDAELKALTWLAAPNKAQSSLLLKITRKKDAGEFADATAEHFSVVLETSVPYRDLQVFDVVASSTRLSVGVTQNEYKGYTQYAVNLKSSADFLPKQKSGEQAILTYTARVTFTLTGEVTFDAYRFREMYGDKTAAMNGDGFTFTVAPGADMYLYFYTTGASSVKVSAVIDDGTAAAEAISGVGEGGLVFSAQ